MEVINETEEQLIFEKKVENLEPIRIFVNDHVAKEKGHVMIEQLRYLKEKDWVMTEYKPLSDGRTLMKFKPPKRIITA